MPKYLIHTIDSASNGVLKFQRREIIWYTIILFYVFVKQRLEVDFSIQINFQNVYIFPLNTHCNKNGQNIILHFPSVRLVVHLTGNVISEKQRMEMSNEANARNAEFYVEFFFRNPFLLGAFTHSFSALRCVFSVLSLIEPAKESSQKTQNIAENACINGMWQLGFQLANHLKW